MVKVSETNDSSGRNIFITVDCFDDHEDSCHDKVMKIPVYRVTKPIYKGKLKEPFIVMNGIIWPSFARYVTNYLLAAD